METLGEVNDQSVNIDVIRTCLQEVELFAGLSHDQPRR